MYFHRDNRLPNGSVILARSVSFIAANGVCRMNTAANEAKSQTFCAPLLPAAIALDGDNLDVTFLLPGFLPRRLGTVTSLSPNTNCCS